VVALLLESSDSYKLHMSDEVATIYDRDGKARLMVFSDGRIVDFKGKPNGFLDSCNVYDYKGNHQGWYDQGILRDKKGECVGFSDKVSDDFHPPFPQKTIRPLPSLIEMEPPRPELKINPPKLLKVINWSTYNPISLFYEL
jgi:hypothetical protein